MSDKVLSERSKALIEETVSYMKREYAGLDLTSPNDVVEYLEALGRKKTTIRINIGTLIAYHKTNTPALDLTEFRAVYTKLTKELAQKTEKQTKEGKEHKSIDWPTVLATAEKIQADEDIPTETKLLVSLYTELPPVRNDYARLLIRKKAPKTDEGNYIVLNSKRGEIVINDHKTSKEYGPLRRTLPDDLRAQFHTYVSENPDKTHLFNVTNQCVAKWLATAFQKHCGKRIASTSLRHSYISEFRKGDKSLMEKRALARAMGHGVDMQELYREIE